MERVFCTIIGIRVKDLGFIVITLESRVCSRVAGSAVVLLAPGGASRRQPWHPPLLLRLRREVAGGEDRELGFGASGFGIWGLRFREFRVWGLGLV